MLGNGKIKVPFMAMNNPSLLQIKGTTVTSRPGDKAIITRNRGKIFTIFLCPFYA